MTLFGAHDLLEMAKLPAFAGEPPWVRDAFRRAPFVVVRRAEAAPGWIAVGVRGPVREARYGTWVEIADVVAKFSPEDLSLAMPREGRASLPAFAALAALRGASPFGAHVWGPCGSAGFELAARVPAATRESDLDLLVRMPEPLPREAAVRMLDEIRNRTRRAGVRIDAQLETPMGGVALCEVASSRPRVMARHANGPRLTLDPWAAATAPLGA